MRPICAFGIPFLLLLGCHSAPVAAPTGPAHEAAADPFAVMAEVDRLAARALWPGFDPRVIPVAIYDGERTLLFRHPAPPDGFEVSHGRDDVWTFSGRHPEVIANTSAMIGGVRTATMMPPAAASPLASRAALLIHEAFHVFQREHHPTWSANEVELFTYPVTEPEPLALRRLETEALRRALAAGRADSAECWTRAALELRQRRFAALPDGAAMYERQTELTEGLATYVEQRAAGNAYSLPLPAEGFPPEAVRQRAYSTGTALALLLDQFLPDWHATLASDDTLSLDALLASTLVGRAGSVGSCGLTPAERESIEQAARADVEALRARRSEMRRLFLEEPGWRLVITATGPPLFPQGFDPLNVQLIAPGEVLHTRFLRLGNEAGAVEVLGRVSLTESAGEHPLFNGVRTLTLTGFPGEPVVTQTEGVVRVQADGVTAELSGATVERIGNMVTILVAGQSAGS